jgi:hypothetical protein
MAIEYAWTFPTLEVTYDEDGLTNVVNNVHWIYTAKDGNYTATTYSTVGLAAPGQPFVDYNDLTLDIVEGWVVDALGEAAVAEMKASLADNIESQKAPKGGNLPPPWATA